MAKYEIFAMVASMKSYNDDQAKVNPVDVALVWGKLAEPEYDIYISYSQNNRWYYYKYDSGSPFSNDFVIAHSANTHIIPANENVKKTVEMIETGDKVGAEGFIGQYGFEWVFGVEDQCDQNGRKRRCM